MCVLFARELSHLLCLIAHTLHTHATPPHPCPGDHRYQHGLKQLEIEKQRDQERELAESQPLLESLYAIR